MNMNDNVQQGYAVEPPRHEQQGNLISILHSPHSLGTPPVRLFGKAWSELIDKGLTDEWIIPFYEGFPVVYAIEQVRFSPICVGFITYQVSYGEAYVRMSYVVPERRRQGIFTQMFDALKARAVEENFKRIAGGTFVQNEPMKATYIATDRRRRSEHWICDL